ncbi:MAG: pyridoxal phosphate-dependent aminotransferase [Ruminococcaceae bacterium]|nr:pyridoxal phosphate-dependent aminotransferase [Oscillospiraceae bacterium]
MLNEKMVKLGTESSAIRQLFEYGKQRKAEIGDDKVFDFSIGNPSVPAPESVNETIRELIEKEDSVLLHGYTSAPGDMAVRTKIANYIKETSGIEAEASNIYMTCGAAASLTVTLTAIANEGDEVILLAPFFPEYRVFAEKAGFKCVVVNCREGDFQIDIPVLEKAINKNTKAIIINSPNNPTGVVFSEETIISLAELLNRKQEELGKEIFLISDEPYRELVYGDVSVPYPANYYNNTVVCYSFSKSLSLPGERIGYIFVSPRCKDSAFVFAAVCGAGRALGFVCAPSMLQRVVAENLGKTANINVYNTNRELLYNALTEYGYTAVKPDGAFYLFVKALESDAAAFAEEAKKQELLLVPSDSFGMGGYVRISYCVSTEQIKASLPAFKKLYEEYNNG